MDQLPPGVDLSKIPLLPPPAGKASNFIDPPSLASIAEGVGGFFIAVETLLLILRTVSNLKTFRKLRLDDCTSNHTFRDRASLTLFRLDHFCCCSELWLLRADIAMCVT